MRAFLSSLLLLCGWVAQAAPHESLAVFRGERMEGKQRFGVQGVGWIVTYKARFGDRRFLLTPAHVSMGAHKAWALTSTATYTLSPWAESPTLDLALLAINEPATDLKPLFDFSPAMRVPELSVKEEAPPPGTRGIYSRKVPADAFGTIEVLWVEGSGLKHASLENIFRDSPRGLHPLAPHAQTYFTNSASIRPGFSGSPLFTRAQPSLPLGMAVKVRVNSSDSAAIPMNEIVKALPALFDRKDSWREAQPDSPHVTYSWSLAEQSLQRTRTIEWQGERFVEPCPDSYHALASSWSPVGGDWGSGGGDWGSGGGTPSAKPDAAYSRDALGRQSYEAYYKTVSQCREPGLRMPDGRHLVGLSHKDEVFQRIQSTEDLMGFLMGFKKPRKALDKIKSWGVFAEDPDATLSVLCNKSVMGPHLQATGAGGGAVFKQESAHIKINPVGWNFFPEDVKGSDFKSLTCSDDKKSLRVQLNFESPVFPLKIDLAVGVRRLTGTVQLGRCEIKVDQPKPLFWNAVIETPEITSVIDLEPANDPVNWTILRLDPKCIPEGYAIPWIVIHRWELSHE